MRLFWDIRFHFIYTWRGASTPTLLIDGLPVENNNSSFIRSKRSELLVTVYNSIRLDLEIFIITNNYVITSNHETHFRVFFF